MLQGLVGTGPEAGCRVVLSSCDKMGNACEVGGARVECTCASGYSTQQSVHAFLYNRICAWFQYVCAFRNHRCTSAEVECKSNDNADGTYTLEWRSKYSGVFEVNALIDKVTVGAPVQMRLRSTVPDLSKTQVTQGHRQIRCVSRYMRDLSERHE